MTGKNVGGIAANLHEGSRSEYLAQYIFASFGTVIPVPHQEDTGVDLYCTLTERVGRVAWPRFHYTVQVKSGMDPWTFGSRESVTWLVKHPVPLFLCVVDKSRLHIRLYQTFARFLVWISGELPTSLELVPAEGAKATDPTVWNDGKSFSLGAPVLDLPISDLCDDDVLNNSRAVIEFWLQRETYNLTMVMAGIPQFAIPHPYETNSPKHRGTSWQGAGAQMGIDSMRDTLAAAIAKLGDYHLRKDDMRGMARVALLARYLWPKPDHGTLTGALADLPFVQAALNDALNAKGYVFAGVDKLSEKFDELLS